VQVKQKPANANQNHSLQTKDFSDESEFQQIVNSFCNVQTRAGKLQIDQELDDFVHYVAQNFSDFSKLQDLYNDIDKQIAKSANKYKANELKILKIKKSALEKFLENLFLKGSTN